MSSKKKITKSKIKKPPIKDDKFIDEDNDKRVMAFVIIAILAIIGIVVGFLVGCQKEEEEKVPEDITPEKEEVKHIDEVDDLVEVEEEKVYTSVVKTTSKTTEKNKYTVVFDLNDGFSTTEKKVEDGNKITPEVPAGYSSCEYYDSEGQEFDFNKGIYGNTTIQMTCELITYSITYDPSAETNPVTYNVEEKDTVLAPITSNDKIFVGWYTGKNGEVYSNKITSLTPSIINYADASDNIALYGKLVDKLVVTFHDKDGNDISRSEATVNNYIRFNIPSIQNACSEDTELLGWSKSSNSKDIYTHEGDYISLTDNLNLYPVCGSTTVTYVSEGMIVGEVGLTDEEVPEYELPDDEDLGLEAPTYFVKVEEESETSKVVIADTDDEIDEDKEVEIGEITNDRIGEKSETPEIGNFVEEKEMEFNGWTIDHDEDPVTEDVPVLDDYTPPVGKDVELNADWVQQEEDRAEPEVSV